jgi:hypothetical protein
MLQETTRGEGSICCNTEAWETAEEMAELRAGEEGAEVTVKKISIWFPTEKKSLGIRRVLEKRLLRV